ncbi:MAG TPA: cation transporter [Rubrobacteraceae bacterium]|nr:cation transporter [Rubrobacteraceae bacterium]
MTEVTFRVPDMSCAHCKAAVEGELQALPGIEKANADVAMGTVEVRYDESKVGTEDLKSAIEEAGYRVAA